MPDGSTTWIRCRICEPRVHDKTSYEERGLVVLVGRAKQRYRLLSALLRDRTPRRSGGTRLRVPEAAQSASPDPSGLDTRLLQLEAERRDAELNALVTRGPLQSRPAWEQELEEADRASREAWSLYADSVFGRVQAPVYLV